MAPFTGNPIGAFKYFSINGNAAAAAGSHDDPEYDLKIFARALDALGQGKTIGIVLHAYLPADALFNVLLKWHAIQAVGVGILDKTSGRIYAPGCADSDRETDASRYGLDTLKDQIA
jgi:hypothetical protein